MWNTFNKRKKNASPQYGIAFLISMFLTIYIGIHSEVITLLSVIRIITEVFLLPLADKNDTKVKRPGKKLTSGL